MSDDDNFAMMAGHVRTVAEAFLTEQFGERCKDFEPNCECCKRWAAMEQLLHDPFATGPCKTELGGTEK